ncbi:MAG: hypothetical protein COX41_07265 [Candidatus Omnitrophica bacterium CG23_combo_of_CG06-09_8_20_14_all_41_10]|uniref:Translation elongation factor-like protein n=1 Tax=Candidatus Sherwoodlollariibacterium unditelluris TaxID=1974757 RepID=A0A2G9YHH6_9BACT|nr:MAG: hypothetical protein COX41_07265 [Candidatus Omnitrophica bacterium CG23_combo_of_CG06-09_8_20_14_all_41_10]
MVLKKKKVIKKKLAKKKTVKKSPAKKRVVKIKQVKKARPKLKTKPKANKPAGKIKEEKLIGVITHYFPHVQAAVIKLKAPLSAGDKIRIKGHTTDFTQVITSMQIEHVNITSAEPGQEIGLLVNSRVRQHDKVSKA